MEFKLLTLFTLLTLTVALPQQYHTYYGQEEKPDTSSVYKQVSEHHINPIKYELSYSNKVNDQPEHIQESSQLKNTKDNIDKEHHYEEHHIPESIGYKHFIDYDTANNKMEYETIVHHHQHNHQSADAIPSKKISEQKYFLPNSKEDDYRKELIAVVPVTSYHEKQPIVSYSDESIQAPTIVYQHESHQHESHQHASHPHESHQHEPHQYQTNQHKSHTVASSNQHEHKPHLTSTHQLVPSQHESNHQFISHQNIAQPQQHHEIPDNSHYSHEINNESIDNTQYEPNSYHEITMKHHAPTHGYSGGDDTSSKHNHFPSTIYYQEEQIVHDPKEKIAEPKYILVKAEKSITEAHEQNQQEPSSMNINYEHEKPKTIKYSSAHTSSHVSFNGPNASYHY